jgi:hypothetical protein
MATHLYPGMALRLRETDLFPSEKCPFIWTLIPQHATTKYWLNWFIRLATVNPTNTLLYERAKRKTLILKCSIAVLLSSRRLLPHLLDYMYVILRVSDWVCVWGRQSKKRGEREVKGRECEEYSCIHRGRQNTAKSANVWVRERDS